jgi:Flp pilus assembly pilin Flp
MKRFMKQLGQGMTEYIIIVALIAIAAIGVYSMFGDTVTDQMGAMTAELSGGTGTVDVKGDTELGASTQARGLGDYTAGNDAASP